MITRQQYNQALDIIEQYHKQLFDKFFITKTKNWDDLQTGDYVIFDRSANSNILTDKPYQVVYVGAKWKLSRLACFGIMMENGKEKWLRKYANGYRVRIT